MTVEALMTLPAHRTCQHKMYGMGCAEYEALVARSRGACELCGIPAEQVRTGVLQIDHDPKYGWNAVRGLLCPKCNTHLAMVDAGRRQWWGRRWGQRDRAFRENAWFLWRWWHEVSPSGTRTCTSHSPLPFWPPRRRGVA